MELVNNKNIKKKVSISIKQQWLGLNMLKHKLSTINVSNKEFINTVKQFYSNEKLEETLDPRL